MCEEEAEKASLDNAGAGFGLVVAAGLSTAVGAAAVYFPRLVQLASKQVLAAGLGFSGGVMLYVSFLEIFGKAKEAFVADGKEEKHAYLIATVCLFCGMAILRIIALLVHSLDKGHAHGSYETDPSQPQIRSNVMGMSDVPAEGTEQAGAATGESGTPASQAAEQLKDKKLEMMGVNTALAIAIHNFPEGLATFVATLVDPAVGATLAIAIAIHNIPEGLCVALPIFYATGSRHKGFLWALLSGLSEPIGAGIGWAIIKGSGEDMNQTIYGVLFGLVAGMMIMIVLLELLPTGFRYDPQDKYVTNSLVLGMFVMALSLVLFQF